MIHTRTVPSVVSALFLAVGLVSSCSSSDNKGLSGDAGSVGDGAGTGLGGSGGGAGQGGNPIGGGGGSTGVAGSGGGAGNAGRAGSGGGGSGGGGMTGSAGSGGGAGASGSAGSGGGGTGGGGTGGSTGTFDGGRDAVASDGRAADAAPLMCVAGGRCTGVQACQASCGAGRIQRCVCNNGELLCNRCAVPDSGATDVPNRIPACPGNVRVQGRQCADPGDRCDYPTDGGGLGVCFCVSQAGPDVWECP